MQNVKPNILNPMWKYIPAAATDVAERFRSMGWIGPEQQRREQQDINIPASILRQDNN